MSASSIEIWAASFAAVSLKEAFDSLPRKVTVDAFARRLAVDDLVLKIEASFSAAPLRGWVGAGEEGLEVGGDASDRLLSLGAGDELLDVRLGVRSAVLGSLEAWFRSIAS